MHFYYLAKRFYRVYLTVFLVSFQKDAASNLCKAHYASVLEENLIFTVI